MATHDDVVAIVDQHLIIGSAIYTWQICLQFEQCRSTHIVSMATRTVDFSKHYKAFGFIATDEGAPEFVVHVSGLIKGGRLRISSKVSQELGQDRKSCKSNGERMEAESLGGCEAGNLKRMVQCH